MAIDWYDATLGFCFIALGLYGLSLSLGWIWWDLLVAAFRLSFVDSPARMMVSMSSLILGVGVILYRPIQWMDAYRSGDD